MYNEEESHVNECEDFAIHSNHGSVSGVRHSDEEEHSIDSLSYDNVVQLSPASASNFYEIHMVAERGTQPI